MHAKTSNQSVETKEQVREAANAWLRQVYFETGEPITACDYDVDVRYGGDYRVQFTFTLKRSPHTLVVTLPVLDAVDRSEESLH